MKENDPNHAKKDEQQNDDLKEVKRMLKKKALQTSVLRKLIGEEDVPSEKITNEN